jgi:hypothetical protein
MCFSKRRASFTTERMAISSGNCSNFSQKEIEQSWVPKFLMQIGKIAPTKGSNDTTQLGKPAEISFEKDANELYVADGYGNRRVIVFDATSGAYKRHWGRLWQ